MTAPEREAVLILGYGEMGHALQILLDARHAPMVWQRHPSEDLTPVALEDAVPRSQFILFCLPATAHGDVARRIQPLLASRDTLCVTIAKGLDDAGQLPSETLAGVIGSPRVAVLYGPMISEEIRAGKPSFAQCAAPDAASGARLAALFAGSRLHIESAEDLTGLSWSAILKNVYAMAFGMADGLALGDNVRGFLAVRALHELAQLVKTLGGNPLTPYRLAGLGDLITTATSRGSHHHELGMNIARGDRNALGGEGVHTLAMLRARPRFDPARFPLFRLIEDCVREPQDVRARLDAFLAAPWLEA